MVVIVYSSIMIGICPELPGSGRSRWTTNHLVTQQKIRNTAFNGSRIREYVPLFVERIACAALTELPA